MHRDAKIALIIIGLPVLCICATCWLSMRPVENNSFAYFERYYGVDEKTVAEVAQAYGVKPQDMTSYGEMPFPINYIEHTLGWAWDQPEHPIIYRRDVESVVKGYVSKCDWIDTSTLYLFYSDWLNPHTIFHGEALVMEVGYELDATQEGIRDDQVLQNITFYSLGDSGGMRWKGIAPICEPPARFADCEVRLPFVGCGVER
jgi:hypothetical protein